ncbi:MBL fold metallo-hydrolase [Amycolatopsis jejuensis]|uniref:MBL fold metallo-hydrolase n=1 Tax=Amycolatopsis jejuensis TaxID=330084 RepID=UPI000689D6A8|nr:hypothetical protein [Amycolatopsis jejuensis]
MTLRLTWLGVANWLFEAGDTQILYNAYFSRIPQEEFYGGPIEFDHARAPRVPDKETVADVVAAVSGERGIGYVFTGHSHFDHTFDVAAVAELTGARVVGSRSTKYQALAQGIPAGQCTEVSGGEHLVLADGLEVWVVRWDHGLADVAPEISEPRELAAVPVPDPETGGLYAGALDAFPNGGGSRGYLFSWHTGETRLTWFVIDASAVGDPQRPVVVDGVDHGRPFDNLRDAMADAGIERVDLWIGPGMGLPDAEESVAGAMPLLRPRVFIPHHFDSIFAPFHDGIGPDSEFSSPAIEDTAARAGASLHVPQRYLDGWQLTGGGLAPVDTTGLRRRLGLP